MSSTQRLTRIAFVAAIFYVGFRMFADILYLEMITFLLFVFAQVLPRREVVAAAGLCALLQLLLHGIMLWNIAYLLIFPSYACLFSLGRNWSEKHLSIVPFVGALASFLIGQLVELPFLLVGKTITWVYLLMGLKTSLLQAGLSFVVFLFLYEPLKNKLKRIIRS